MTHHPQAQAVALLKPPCEGTRVALICPHEQHARQLAPPHGVQQQAGALAVMEISPVHTRGARGPACPPGGGASGPSAAWRRRSHAPGRAGTISHRIAAFHHSRSTVVACSTAIRTWGATWGRVPETAGTAARLAGSASAISFCGETQRESRSLRDASPAHDVDELRRHCLFEAGLGGDWSRREPRNLISGPAPGGVRNCRSGLPQQRNYNYADSADQRRLLRLAYKPPPSTPASRRNTWGQGWRVISPRLPSSRSGRCAESRTSGERSA